MSLKIVLIVSLILSVCAFGSAQETACKANEEFNSCGSACPETCDNVLKPDSNPSMCTMQCVSGCFCRSGMVRNNLRNNECVQRDDCRKSLLRDGGNNGSYSLLATKFSFISIVASVFLFLSFSRFF